MDVSDIAPFLPGQNFHFGDNVKPAPVAILSPSYPLLYTACRHGELIAGLARCKEAEVAEP